MAELAWQLPFSAPGGSVLRRTAEVSLTRLDLGPEMVRKARSERGGDRALADILA